MNNVNAATGQGKAGFSNRGDQNLLKDRLGFANRNLTAVRNATRPSGMKALGDNYLLKLARTDKLISSAVREKVGRWDTGTNTSRVGSSVGGVCALELQHIFGWDDPYRENQYTDIFATYWARVRSWYTGGEKIAPVDLQMYIGAAMELYAHLANVRRILKAIHSNYASGNNKYIKREVMPAWFGFRIANNDELTQDNFLYFAGRFNKIIESTANVLIPKSLIPGFKRWASFYTCAYKDEDVSGDYSQNYVFFPRKLYILTESEIPASKLVKVDSGKATDFSKVKASSLSPKLKAYVDAHTPSDVKVENLSDTVIAWELVGTDDMYSKAYTSFTDQFKRYFDLLQVAANALTKDSSALELTWIIQNVLQQVVLRDKAADPDFCNVEPLWNDLMDNDPEPMDFVYDPQTLLSIHNATIMNGLQVHSFSQLMPSMIGFQQLNATAGSPSAYLANCCKPLDMPSQVESMNDFISATQWTITNLDTYDPTTATIGATDGFAYGAFKTDVITGGYILLYNETASDVQAQTDFSVRKIPLMQLVPWMPATLDAAAYTSWSTWCTTYYGTADDVEVSPVSYLTIVGDFRYFPMIYAFEQTGTGARVTLNDVYDQSGCLYFASFNEMSDLNIAFVENFWGYPFVNKGLTAEFSYGAGDAEKRSIR